MGNNVNLAQSQNFYAPNGTSSAVKLLNQVSNYFNYTMLYTELDSHLNTGDIVYITNGDIVYHNNFSLDNYLVNLNNNNFPYCDWSLGYQIVFTNSEKNQLVINKPFDSLPSGVTLENHYISRVSFNNGEITGGYLDSSIFKNIKLTGTTSTHVQFVALNSIIQDLTFNNKYKFDYLSLNSSVNMNPIGFTIDSRYSYDNDKYDYTYVYDSKLYGCDFNNGYFTDCYISGVTSGFTGTAGLSYSSGGYFDTCVFDNYVVNNGYYFNCHFFNNFSPNIIWNYGSWDHANYNIIMDWQDGIWNNGILLFGDWYNGIFNNGYIIFSNWYGGIFNDGYFNTSSDWYGGVFNNGYFENSYWKNGTFNNGYFYNSSWSGGTFNNGQFTMGSIWVDGTFNNGQIWNWEPSGSLASGVTWLHGTFNNGVFRDSEWYDGIFNGGNFISSQWYNGEFYKSPITNNVISRSMAKLSMFSGGTIFGGSVSDSIISATTIKNGAFNTCTIAYSTINNGTFNNCNIVVGTRWYGGSFNGGYFLWLPPDVIPIWSGGTFTNGTFGVYYMGANYTDWCDGIFKNGLFRGNWCGGQWLGGTWAGFNKITGDNTKPGTSNFTPYNQNFIQSNSAG